MRKSLFSLLNVDYVQLDEQWNYQNIISPFLRLYLIDNGNGRLFNSEASIKLRKNFIYLIPSFTSCNYQCDHFLSQYFIHIMEESSSGNSLFALSRKIFELPATEMDHELFKRLLKVNPGRDLRRSSDPKVYEKQTILNEYKQLNYLTPVAEYMETQGIILQLLSRFVKSDSLQTIRVVTSSKILDTVNYIQTNLKAKLTVGHLAERANLNTDHFSRMFKESVGYRPLNYIQIKRIERAQFLMSSTDRSLSDIAMETGFEDIFYFSRIFKKVTSQNPASYRRNLNRSLLL